MTHDGSVLAVVGAGLALIVLLSLPSAASLAVRLYDKKNTDSLYEDGDGKATLLSTRAFSAKLPKSIVILLASIGTALSLATSFLSTSREDLSVENWLTLASWASLVFQAVAIASGRTCIQAYNLGIYSFFSSLLLFFSLLAQETVVAKIDLRDDPLIFSLRIAELVVALVLTFASLTLPRRPDVFFNGRLVDKMYTVSALTRFTYSWPRETLSLARKKKSLDMVDLARPNQYTRAESLSADWKRRNLTHRLWISLVLAHKRTFALQWSLTFVTSILNFAPQWVILQFLQILESGRGDQGYGLDVWMWVVWMGLAIIAQSWVESYVFWLSWAELLVPVRAQLAALIFEKAMRRKDVKGGGAATKKSAVATADAGSSGSSLNGTAGETGTADKTETPPDENDSEEVKKTKQSTVNLIGVDGKTISELCANQNAFPGSVFKLIVSLTFLIHLLGWKPLLAGFSAMLAIMPLNIHFSKKYANAQSRLMKVRDEKMEVVTEALQGIRQIKFSALEPEWEEKINSVRDRELSTVWEAYMADVILIGCWITSPVLLAAISLAVYAILTGSLTPSVAFVSLGVFKALEVTLSVIPELTTDLLDAWVSVKRIEEYLNSPEIAPISKEGPEVAFENATITWPADEKLDDSERFALRDVNVAFPDGELSVISGKTGTGKSLMLSAILGEVDLLAGNLYVPTAPALLDRHDSRANKGNWIIPGAIAYVAQIPWIENASIKENVLFGLPFDPDRYTKTIEVCALKKDLEMLTDGEETEIGANGINLSGGQKWRVTLARAIYSRASILVLDDIFSAVDAHVGRHIFEKCLTGELAAGRTRILVTHHVGLCESKTKYLVELGGGGVLHAGLVSDLRQDGTLRQIKSHEQSQEEIDADQAPTVVNSDASSNGEGSNGEGDNEHEHTNGDGLHEADPKQAAVRKFVEEEAREEGAVRRHVYATYMKDSGGYFFWIPALAICVFVQALTIGRSWWLRIWTSEEVRESVSLASTFNASKGREYAYAFGLPQTYLSHSVGTTTMGPTVAAEEEENHHGLAFYLGIYVVLSISAALVSTFRFYYLYTGSIRASRRLFAKLNFTVLRAPLRWLDTVPVGRILNRFTADAYIVDNQLANSLGFGANSFFNLLGVIIASLFVSPYVIVMAFFLLLIALYYGRAYLDAARPVKRLESTAKSPVFEQFGSALTGVATIRGFDRTQVYVQRMFSRIDDHSTSSRHLWLFNRWMGLRMALVGSLFASFVATLLLLTPGVDSALAGFALAFALEFSGAVVMTIRLYANVELNMNATERIVEYTELPTEPLDGKRPSAAWPAHGRIEVEDLKVTYASDLPPVLKGLTFTVNPNERIGVVGRTGAGKSSLTLALFRFLEAQGGNIYIDGIDISTIRLHDLRSRLAIIPQDPVLFSGTIRSNLDPFDHHDDRELHDCLERVHLAGSPSKVPSATDLIDAEPSSSASTITATNNTNTNAFDDLGSPVSEGGLNLSQGQRQLLCLARAIVSRPKVMVLDEATSAVDMHTDALIQRSIRDEFTDATLLVIAHRLSTIADFDRILVLSDGQVAEYGTPRELWDKGKEGIFRAMCEESGERDKLENVVFKKQ